LGPYPWSGAQAPWLLTF